MQKNPFSLYRQELSRSEASQEFSNALLDYAFLFHQNVNQHRKPVVLL